MKQDKVTITSAAGIHARPAGEIVNAAKTFTSTITLTKDGKEAKANRLISILGLGAKKGEEITITTEGDDEDVALEAIKKIILEAE